jgi:spore maturation protein CgeB
VNSGKRSKISEGYFHTMHNSRIIVTCNPSKWEGDYRFMEAMASGALIFVDKMYTPRWNELIDGKHVIYYDNTDERDLFQKLDFYRNDPALAEQIAIAGYLHAMKYHRAANLIDYIFRTVHSLNSSTLPYKYHETGVDMRQIILDRKLQMSQ